MLESTYFAHVGLLGNPPVLKQAAKAHRALAELKGIAATIPNENILIQTLALQEAKHNSALAAIFILSF